MSISQDTFEEIRRQFRSLFDTYRCFSVEYFKFTLINGNTQISVENDVEKITFVIDPAGFTTDDIFTPQSTGWIQYKTNLLNTVFGSRTVALENYVQFPLPPGTGATGPTGPTGPAGLGELDYLKRQTTRGNFSAELKFLDYPVENYPTTNCPGNTSVTVVNDSCFELPVSSTECSVFNIKTNTVTSEIFAGEGMGGSSVKSNAKNIQMFLDIETVNRLVGSDTTAGDAYGTSVSISGNTIVIGAPDKRTVYVYDLNETTLVFDQTQIITSPGTAGDDFGFSVVIEGDIIAIGAPGDTSSTGRVHIRDRNTGGTDNWGEVIQITASDAAVGDEFGFSLSLNQQRLIVGAPQDDAAIGSVYVFDGTAAWTEINKVLSLLPIPGNQFGYSVGIRNIDGSSYIAVGSPNITTSTGAVEIYERLFGSYIQIKLVTASDAAINDRFGTSLSLGNSILVVGAEGETSDTGAAYVFEQNIGGTDNWGQVKKLTAFDGVPGDKFGASVLFTDNEFLLVGAPNKDSNSGAVYVHIRNLPIVGQYGLFKEIKGNSDDLITDSGMFGNALSAGFTALTNSISGEFKIFTVIGAKEDSVNGVGGGAAYVCEFPFPPVIDKICSDCPRPLFIDRDIIVEKNKSIRAKVALQITQKDQDFYQGNDSADLDELGNSVAIFGDVMVVGAPKHAQSGPTTDAGAVYVYRRQGSDALFVEEVALKAQESGPVDDFATGDEFGTSVAIYNNTIVVGAPKKTVMGTPTAGKVYVYNFDGSSWSFTQSIDLGGGAVISDEFGASVAIYGDRILIGKTEIGTSPGGEVLAYRLVAGTWTLEDTLTGTSTPDEFGTSVSLDGTTAVIGSATDEAYIFERSGVSWSETVRLVGSDTMAGDEFGARVSISGDIAVVGAPLHDVSGFAGTDHGAVYVFQRDEGGADMWGQTSKVVSPNVDSGAKFGASVSIISNTLIVGEVEGSGGTGRIYAYTVGTSSVSQIVRIETPTMFTTVDPVTNTFADVETKTYGTSVAVGSDNTVVIGAPTTEITPAGGSAEARGAAYTFDLPLVQYDSTICIRKLG